MTLEEQFDEFENKLDLILELLNEKQSNFDKDSFNLMNNRKTFILNKFKNKNYSKINISIKTPNPVGDKRWGDYFFASSLKKEFEKKGFNVFLHEFGEWYVDSDEEIVIVLRGLESYNVNEDNFNIMWNISHPKEVSLDEYQSYDLVFIASEEYASKIDKLISNTQIEPLLQCTDDELFFPNYDKVCEENILFVGSSRHTFRKIIKDILKTNHNFSVYGFYWNKFINDKYIKGNFIQNPMLSKYYSSCKILLNDHWDDMRLEDFPSNRLFDALACGTFVISDDIPSAHTLFEDTIVTYKDYKDLDEKLSYYLNHEEERREIAKRGQEIVLKNHTFKNRVDTILETLIEF